MVFLLVLLLVLVLTFAIYVFLTPTAVDFYTNPDPRPRFNSMDRLE